MTLTARLARLVLLSVAASATGTATAQGGADARLQELDRIFGAHVAARHSPGLSVGIVIGGRLVLAKGYGKRSIARDLPVDADTRFSIGSVTKQFTCACVLLLAEDGKLSVYDKVAKYHPDLARAADITLLDLMNHVSGYPDYYPLDFVDRRMATPIEPDALLERYAGKAVRLDFEPGTAWSYSNTGYILLGRVVEKVTGRPFAEFLQRRILDPLGMQRTLYDPDLEQADPERADIAAGYTSFALGPPESNTPEARGWVAAAGGIYSTPTDLARWDIALLEGRVLRPESFALMTRRRRLANQSLAGYGCGLLIGQRSGSELLSHGGAISGFVAWNGVLPSMRAAVILLANQDGGLPGLADRVLEVLLRTPPKAAPTALPKVAGPTTEDTVRAVFAMLQRGAVDRRRFTADFNDYLTESRLAGARQRLSGLGTPDQLRVSSRRERGGMAVTSTRLVCGKTELRVVMYRHPDGSIAQFFVR